MPWRPSYPGDFHSFSPRKPLGSSGSVSQPRCTTRWRCMRGTRCEYSGKMMGKFITPYWKTTARVSSFHDWCIFEGRLALVLQPPLSTRDVINDTNVQFEHYRGKDCKTSYWHFGLKVYFIKWMELSIIRVKVIDRVEPSIEKPDQLVVFPMRDNLICISNREQTVFALIITSNN